MYRVTSFSTCPRTGIVIDSTPNYFSPLAYDLADAQKHAAELNAKRDETHDTVYAVWDDEKKTPLGIVTEITHACIRCSPNKGDRASFYASEEAGDNQGWDGICVSCSHSYFQCRGNCTCLSCNAQRQDEIKNALWFDEDGEKDKSNIEYRDAVGGKWRRTTRRGPAKKERK